MMAAAWGLKFLMVFASKWEYQGFFEYLYKYSHVQAET